MNLVRVPGARNLNRDEWIRGKSRVHHTATTGPADKTATCGDSRFFRSLHLVFCSSDTTRRSSRQKILLPRLHLISSTRHDLGTLSTTFVSMELYAQQSKAIGIRLEDRSRKSSRSSPIFTGDLHFVISSGSPSSCQT